jgi:hypothetical protein
MKPSGIYYFAQLLDEWEGTNYDGTSVRGGAKVAHKAGFISSYKFARTLDAVLYHILEHGPVVMGTSWYSGMNSPNERTGIITPTGRTIGGHAYLAYGANVSKGLLSIRNSWGLDWGIKGRARLSFENVERLLEQRGEACTPVEIKVGYSKKR